MQKRKLLLAPTVVFVVLSVVFAKYQLFPFGTHTAAWCDMYQQVIPLLMDLKDILEGKSGLFLNLQNSGGMNLYGVLLFFVSSPFSFLVLLVKKSEIYLWINVLVMLKMMVCAVTVSFFFYRRFKDLNTLQNTALSVMYAFSGYVLFYYQNVVWLDAVYLFPLLLLSLLDLVEKERIVPYTIALSAYIVINFYLSYMVVLFLIFASGLYLFLCVPQEERGRKTLLLGFSTLTAAIFTAVIWLPSLLQYTYSARTENFITSIETGSFFTSVFTTGSLMTCTAIIFAAILFSFFSKQKSKVKRFCMGMFALLFIPVWIEPINKMWHTGTYQAFPLRYSYMTIFFGLILAAQILSEQNQTSKTRVSTLFGIFLGSISTGAVFIVSKLLLQNKYETLTVYTRTLWGNQDSFTLLAGFAAATVAAYILIFCLSRWQYIGKMAFSILLCVLTLVESSFYTSVYMGSASAPVEGYQAVTDLQNRIKDTSIFRVKNEKKYFDVNLMGGIGYGSLSHYTSLTSKEYMSALKKLGYSSYWMEVNSNGGTIFTDAILGNKYQISFNDASVTLPVFYKNNIYAMQKLPFALSGFGLATDGNALLKMQTLSEKGSRFTLQKELFHALFPDLNEEFITEYQPDLWDNVTQTFEEINRLSYVSSKTQGSFEYHIRVDDTQTLYFDCFDKISNNLTEPINGSFNIFVNGKLVTQNYPSQSENGMLNLGTFTNETVKIQVQLLKPVSARSIGVAGYHHTVLQKALSTEKSADLQQFGNKLEGTVQAKTNGEYLFLPVSNTEGCTVLINGKRQPVQIVLDSFIAVKLEKGQNQLEFSFTAPGFKSGFVISLCGLLLLVFLPIVLRKLKHLYVMQQVAQGVFITLFVLTFLGVYILPIGIYFL